MPSDDAQSLDGTERVGCYVLEREGKPDRYFSGVYPTLSEGWPTSRVTIAYWEVDTSDTGTEQEGQR